MNASNTSALLNLRRKVTAYLLKEHYSDFDEIGFGFFERWYVRQTEGI